MHLVNLAKRVFSHISRWIVRGIFLLVCRVHIRYFGEPPAGIGYIVASNHISHFDPPLLGSCFRRYIDWMAMEELFRNPASAILMNWLCAFKVQRDGTDRSGIRVALRRLDESRVIGIFPEGGIRAGKGSVLEGAAMWPGVSAICVMAGKPIVPSVILGTDRLYRKRNWFSFRRVPVWIGIGEPIFPGADTSGTAARESVQTSLASAFVAIKEKLVSEFKLSPNDLPATPQGRKRENYLP
jgi:1-acyl-sn-glycerol-3-phosphate acyltransferase